MKMFSFVIVNDNLRSHSIPSSFICFVSVALYKRNSL